MVTRTPSSTRRLLLALTTLALAACSAQQAYGVGQGWQLNDCGRIADAQERARCQDRANTPYDTYRRDSESARRPN